MKRRIPVVIAILSIAGLGLGAVLAAGVQLPRVAGGAHSEDVPPPPPMSLQGRLTDPATGAPYSGNKSVTFSIWDAATGGDQVWSENQTLALDANGFFDTYLGETSPIPSLSDPAYLQIQVDGEILSPRSRLGSAPFALNGVPPGFSVISGSASAPTGFTLAETVNTGDIWRGTAPMALPRLEFAAAALDGKLYAIGGNGGGSGWGIEAAVEEYDPVSATWTTKASLPTPRYSLGAAAAGGRIYAIGGRSYNGTYWEMTGANEEYDPASDTWTARAPLPTARDELVVVAVNDRIYAIGGDSYWGGSTAVEEYDPATDSWSTKSPMLTPRLSFAGAVVDGKIYVFGGSSTEGQTSTVEEYDPQTDTWRTRASMPSGVQTQMAAASLGGKAYVIGGRLSFSLSNGWASTVKEYDPVSDTWVGRASLSESRALLAAVAVDNAIYALGGEGSTRETGTTVEKYTPPSVYYIHRKD